MLVIVIEIRISSREHDYDQEYEMAHFPLAATIASVRYVSRLLP
jgi:hypothetical protein